VFPPGPGPKSAFWRVWFFKRRWKERFSPWREQNNDVVWEIELSLFKTTLCCLNLTQHYPVARTVRVGRIALVRITNCIPVDSGTNLIFLLLREHTKTHTDEIHTRTQFKVPILYNVYRFLWSRIFIKLLFTSWHKLTCAIMHLGLAEEGLVRPFKGKD